MHHRRGIFALPWNAQAAAKRRSGNAAAPEPGTIHGLRTVKD
jgi:hypothetical protein